MAQDPARRDGAPAALPFTASSPSAPSEATTVCAPRRRASLVACNGSWEPVSSASSSAFGLTTSGGRRHPGAAVRRSVEQHGDARRPCGAHQLGTRPPAPPAAGCRTAPPRRPRTPVRRTTPGRRTTRRGLSPGPVRSAGWCRRWSGPRPRSCAGSPPRRGRARPPRPRCRRVVPDRAARPAAGESRRGHPVAERREHPGHVQPFAAGAFGHVGHPVRGVRPQRSYPVGDVESGVQRDCEDHLGDLPRSHGGAIHGNGIPECACRRRVRRLDHAKRVGGRPSPPSRPPYANIRMNHPSWGSTTHSPRRITPLVRTRRPAAPGRRPCPAPASPPVVDAQQLRRVGRDGRPRPPPAAGDGDGPPEGAIQGECRARDRTALHQPCHTLADLDLQRAEQIAPVAAAGRVHRVGDEGDPPGARVMERQLDGGRVQMRAVVDQLDRDPLVLQERGDGPGCGGRAAAWR